MNSSAALAQDLYILHKKVVSQLSVVSEDLSLPQTYHFRVFPFTVDWEEGRKFG